MLDFTNCNIEKLSVHYVGNRANDDGLILSKSPVEISDLKLRDLLFKFFLNPFSSPEFHSFTFPNGDFTLNPLYSFASQIFDVNKSFHKNTEHIAKQLYDASSHPQVKSGDLFVVYFSDVAINDEMTDAIGIFKSENKDSFLKLNILSSEYSINYDEGISINNLDKGCLIFNSDRETGFKVCSIDKSNRSNEAQYWKEEFLRVKPFSDDYNKTKDFLSIAKNFVTKQLSRDFEVDRTEQINLLNRSVEYFKSNDVFDRKMFEKNVFNDKEVIKSFRKFDDMFRDQNGIEIDDSFEISHQAVKKQSKIFKSTIKLDSNFDIYVHGDTTLIEKGIEKDGRKFYKLYYQKEV